MKSSTQTESCVRTKDGPCPFHLYMSGWLRGEGVDIGDAFNFNLDYSVRLQAQRIFYEKTRKAQDAVARQADLPAGTMSSSHVKPNLDPFFAGYPSLLSGYAAIGLSAFLEFEKLAGTVIFDACVKACLEDTAAGICADPEDSGHRGLIKMTARVVQRRLILQELAGNPELIAVEIYRLFSASRQSLRICTLEDILNAVVVYGDVLPELGSGDIHPAARDLLQEIRRISLPYIAELGRMNSSDYLKTGVQWAVQLFRRLVCGASELEKAAYHPDPAGRCLPAATSSLMDEVGGEKSDASIWRLPPLNAPSLPRAGNAPGLGDSMIERIPMLFTDQDKKFLALKCCLGEETPIHRLSKALETLRSILNDFRRKARLLEGILPEFLEIDPQYAEFMQGVIQDASLEGHSILFSHDGVSLLKEDIFDRPMIPSEDQRKFEALIQDAGETTAALTLLMHPNIAHKFQADTLKNSGAIDPARLFLCGISEAIFRRFQIRESADREQPATLVIACDGSSSLQSCQMKMVKILSAAWLLSASGKRINILAGLYHSGNDKRGHRFPMVQWIWHPRKTPTASRIDAVRCIVGLPDYGTGVQSDALSLAFIMDEARSEAKGNSIYFIHITDCAWNRSFNAGISGAQEVRFLYEKWLHEFGAKLDITLVALGINGKTGLEDLAQKVIPFSKDQLKDYEAVSREIALYVGSCIREREARRAP